ncbi:conserved hypothetical protein [Echinococcus multilocularis]|uniref:Uncharacterized protein n=1 Tax=Echinococcus multilocularis TaxID=6211 RepID=A0A068Y721_ECHMU|nr:conserved hypothetical protein [Echinococcus multilocularis]
MNYIYIIVPACFSLLIFALTVGYLLLVKYKANRLLKSIRRGMIMKYCSPEFVVKPPNVTHGHMPFSGVYREPRVPMVNKGHIQSQSSHVLARNDGFDSMHSIDANSDVIEIPLRPHVYHSSSSSESTEGNYYGGSAYHNKYKGIEEGDSETDSQGGGKTPLEHSKYHFVGEFGPANTFNPQKY